MIGGGLFVGIIHCQDNNHLSIDEEPDYNVILSVDTHAKSSINVQNLLDDQISEPFVCHECINCNRKSDLTTRICESGINMCYTIHKRINKINEIIRRGCSTSKGQCTVPDDNQLTSYDGITCCINQKCNQGIQLKSLLFLLILNLFIMMINL